MIRTMLTLAALVSTAVLPSVTHAQSPVGGAPTTSKEAPPTERKDTRFGVLFPVEELIHPEPTVEVPAAPSAFQTRAQVCFEQSRARDASTAGRMELSVVVRNGRVSSASAEANTTGDPVLAECLVGRARGFRLDDTADGELRWVFVVGAQ